MKYFANPDMIDSKVKSFFGENVALSYPIPELLNGVLVDQYFLYNISNTGEGSRPFAFFAVSSESGTLLFYQNCHLYDFIDTKKHPFDKKISYKLPEGISVKEFKIRKGLIKKLYLQVKKFVFSEELSSENKETFKKYWALLMSSVPEDLIPYYYAISKQLCEWGYKNV